MQFRFKAFSLHLLGSIAVLGTVLGTLYAGWYRWPGWYLTDALQVVPLIALVDLVLGPLLTLVIANPAKPRRELARDIGMIAAVQIVALLYGATTLWQGRPLYYAFSVDRLQLVQASDLGERETQLARQLNPAFAPHWYRVPRWVWAPLPDDEKTRSEIVGSAIQGGDDVIQMPRYFRPWDQGLPQLREQLRPLAVQRGIARIKTRGELATRMRQQRLELDTANTLLFTGRGNRLLVVFDRGTLQIKAMLRMD